MLHTKAQSRKRSNNKKQVAKSNPVYLNEANQIIVSATAKRLKISNSDVVNSLLDSIEVDSNNGKKATAKTDSIILSPENKIIIDDVALKIGKDASFVVNNLLDKIDPEPVIKKEILY